MAVKLWCLRVLPYFNWAVGQFPLHASDSKWNKKEKKKKAYFDSSNLSCGLLRLAQAVFCVVTYKILNKYTHIHTPYVSDKWAYKHACIHARIQPQWRSIHVSSMKLLERPLPCLDQWLDPGQGCLNSQATALTRSPHSDSSLRLPGNSFIHSFWTDRWWDQSISCVSTHRNHVHKVIIREGLQHLADRYFDEFEREPRHAAAPEDQKRKQTLS